MAIKHTVPAGLPTGTVSGKVAGDDWRADHNHVSFEYLIFHAGTTGVYTLTPLTAGTVEPANAPMARVFVPDATYVSQFRIAIGQRIVGAGGTTCNAQLQYATNGATQTSWADAANSAGAGNVSLQGGTANIIRTGSWADLASAAKIADLYCRFAIVTTGTVTTAPTISWAAVMFR